MEKKEKISTDLNQVERIVNRMRKKYEKQGLSFEEVTGELGELRSSIAGGKKKELEVQRIEELKEFESPWVSKLGNLFLKLKTIIKPFYSVIAKLPQTEKLNYYLESAHMKFSARQWLALTTIMAFIVFIITIVLSFLSIAILNLNPVIAILISILIFIITAFIMIAIPKRNAVLFGEDVSRELPFALRHMATELKAGIGLYRTIQIIATSDYSRLSDEFKRVIIEIEEGMDTKDALGSLALRTQSRPFRMALNHMIRALKIGGNLSDLMNQIAEDVAFQLRNKTREFSQKLNFFGVIFIFMAIVMPVLIGILGGIKSTPLQSSVLESLPLNPTSLTIFYVLFMPLMLLWLLVYILVTQPKV